MPANTPEARAAVRANALKHGLTAQKLFVGDERAADWRQFSSGCG